MRDSLEDAALRTQRYWYVDGLGEITGGATILAIGGINTLLEWISRMGWVEGLGTAALPILIVAVILGARTVLTQLKERITYPRTGYIAYRPQPTRMRSLRMAASALTAAFVGLATALAAKMLAGNLFYLAIGLLIAFVTLFKGAQLSLLRFYILAVLEFGVGCVLGVLNLPLEAGLMVFLGLTGFGWILSGIWTLVHYLRSTQPASQDGDAA